MAAYFGVAATIVAASFCLCLFLQSCAPCERLSRLCPPMASETLTVHDSVHVTDTVYIRDTLREVRLLPGTATAVTMPTDTAKAETLYAAATAWLCNGRLSLSIINKDSALALVAETERLRALMQWHSERADIVKVKRKTYVPAAVKALAWTGGAAILYGLMWVIFAVARRLR